MLPDFSRTLRQLDADRGQGTSWMIGAGAAIVAAWTAWGALGELPRELSSLSARVEGDVIPLQVRAAGAVARVYGELGANVHAGDPLLQLDDAALQLELTEAEQKLAAAQTRARLRDQSRSEQAGAASAEAVVSAQHEASLRARLAALQTRTERLVAERDQIRALLDQGAIEHKELTRVESELADVGAELAQQRAQVGGAAAGTSLSAHTARVTRLDGDSSVAAMEAEVAAAEAQVARARQQLAQRRLVAPADGDLGAWFHAQPGQHLALGEQVGALVTTGPRHVVAWFDVGTGIGHLAPGQRATVRLDGFPATRMRGLPATVARVGTEAEAAGLRVELTLDDAPPLQHGLPATADVEVERATPFALLWRLVQG